MFFLFYYRIIKKIKNYCQYFLEFDFKIILYKLFKIYNVIKYSIIFYKISLKIKNFNEKY